MMGYALLPSTGDRRIHEPIKCITGRDKAPDGFYSKLGAPSEGSKGQGSDSHNRINENYRITPMKPRLQRELQLWKIKAFKWPHGPTTLREITPVVLRALKSPE